MNAIEKENVRCSTNDLAGSIRSVTIVWGLPVLAIAAGLFLSGTSRSILWFAGTFVAGTACLINARGCGRLHCYFTGPFFLACAAFVLFMHFGVVNLSPAASQLFGGGILLGGLILFFVPEFIWGKYSKAR